MSHQSRSPTVDCRPVSTHRSAAGFARAALEAADPPSCNRTRTAHRRDGHPGRSTRAPVCHSSATAGHADTRQSSHLGRSCHPCFFRFQYTARLNARGHRCSPHRSRSARS